jgi:uncharacterized protein YacL (UPF0231 family)
MSNKQQTTVEWIEQEMLKGNLSMKEILEQAKEMEKEQAIKLYYEYELYVMMNESDVMTFGQFYKQTYGEK